MVAATYHPRILIPKYGQTGNVKPLTAVCGKTANLDLKVSVLSLRLTANVNLFHVRNQVSAFLVVYFPLFQHIY